MPNYVTSRIRVQAKDWEALKSALINEDGHVDLNKVKPMPDSVYQEVLVGDPYTPPAGYSETWYTWSIREWGTKWNASSTGIDPENNEINFETAWDSPLPVIQKLHEMTGIGLHVLYADEDKGYNLGGYIYETEKIPATFPEQGSLEAVNLSCLIQYGKCAKDYYGQDYAESYTDFYPQSPQLEETYDPWERYHLTPKEEA